MGIQNPIAGNAQPSALAQQPLPQQRALPGRVEKFAGDAVRVNDTAPRNPTAPTVNPAAQQASPIKALPDNSYTKPSTQPASGRAPIHLGQDVASKTHLGEISPQEVKENLQRAADARKAQASVRAASTQGAAQQGFFNKATSAMSKLPFVGGVADIAKSVIAEPGGIGAKTTRLGMGLLNNNAVGGALAIVPTAINTFDRMRETNNRDFSSIDPEGAAWQRLKEQGANLLPLAGAVGGMRFGGPGGAFAGSLAGEGARAGLNATGMFEPTPEQQNNLSVISGINQPTMVDKIAENSGNPPPKAITAQPQETAKAPKDEQMGPPREAGMTAMTYGDSQMYGIRDKNGRMSFGDAAAMKGMGLDPTKAGMSKDLTNSLGLVGGGDTYAQTMEKIAKVKALRDTGQHGAVGGNPLGGLLARFDKSSMRDKALLAGSIENAVKGQYGLRDTAMDNTAKQNVWDAQAAMYQANADATAYPNTAEGQAQAMLAERRKYAIELQKELMRNQLGGIE